MTTIESEEAAVLARARRALSPDAADIARVRHSLAAAVQVAPVAMPAPTRWAARIMWGVAIAGVAGGIGYLAGWHAGQRAVPVPAVVRATSPVEHAPALPASGPARAATPPVSGDRAMRPASPRTPRELKPQTVAPGAALSAADSLAKEVEALRAVDRALRDGQPGLALALLRELDQVVPNGKLDEERVASGAIARCASGAAPPGSDLATEFANRYPRSVYRDRVEAACGETDFAGAGDQPARRSPR
jgi:hypothetical protein